jgi:NADPH:quinone reductase-like Zn-dependent oxidoreductase
MKAIVVHQYGGPEVLKFEEYPDPVAGPGEVLVRVAASSVNPIDYKRRAGLTKDFYPITFPGLIGVDIAGTVVKIGPGVEGFSVGDRVFAISPWWNHDFLSDKICIGDSGDFDDG